VARTAWDKIMDEAADTTREHFTECPWLAMLPHDRVPLVLRLLVVRGTNSNIRLFDGPAESALNGWIHDVVDQDFDAEIRPAFLQPTARDFRLGSSHRRRRKQMALYVMGLVNVRLDYRHPTDAAVAAQHVQYGHAPAPRADLD